MTDKDREEAYGLPSHYGDGDLVDDIRERKYGSYGTSFELDYPVACARVRQYCASIRQDAMAKARREAADKVEVMRKLVTQRYPFSYEEGMADAYENAVAAILSPSAGDDKEAHNG